MRVLPFWIVHLVLVFLLISLTISDFVDSKPEFRNHFYVTHNYDRLNEVKQACSSIIADSTSDLTLNENERINRIKKDLSFHNGDWEQVETSAPLMPFDGIPPQNPKDSGCDLYNFSHSKFDPYKLASFRLTDVTTDLQSERIVNVNGYLYMAITYSPSVTTFDSPVPIFSIRKGHTQLFINFQGIYLETKKNGGKRALCLLGNTTLPSRQIDSADTWESVRESRSSDEPSPLLQDDQILLVLNYPKIVSLKNRIIQGEMRSLNSKTDLKYFGKVQITSQPQVRAHDYEYSPDEIISKACDPYPYPDMLVSDSSQIYKGFDFCSTLQRASSNAIFEVSPNLNYNRTNEVCRKFGPFGFGSDEEIKDIRILMQNVVCVTTKMRENDVMIARVSAVFRAFDGRAFDAPEFEFMEHRRSGLSNMTVVAEGIWKSSSGQLCMIGCLGVGNDCDSRICLYIPLSFSIKQRSILKGSISSINLSYCPLSLKMPFESFDIYESYKAVQPYYLYTKIASAEDVIKIYKPFIFETAIKKSLLTFPRLRDSKDSSESLRSLAQDLTLNAPAVIDPISSSLPSRTDLKMEVLALGPMFGNHWFLNNSKLVNKQLRLNVSTQFTLRKGFYTNLLVLSLEGLYDQSVGKMYMIGCRDVSASAKLLFEGMDDDLVDGLDCLIEVVISYSPTRARWHVIPPTSISIFSQRAEDDPLYFKPIKLQTLQMIAEPQMQRNNIILPKKGYEPILRILTLSMTIACILSQLFYTRNITDNSLPYVSLVMLGSQALGYAFPLVVDLQALFRRNSSNNSEMPSSYFDQTIDFISNLLVLVCLMLTLSICRKVWRSRVLLISQNHNEPKRVPNDKLVLGITSTIHVILNVISLIFKVKTSDQTSVQIVLLQDLFLVPQVISNIIWQTNGKPLRKLYYIGITFVRFIPLAYCNVNRNFDFYSELLDIGKLVLAIVLAVIVYLQQRMRLPSSMIEAKLGYIPRKKQC